MLQKHNNNAKFALAMINCIKLREKYPHNKRRFGFIAVGFK